MNVKNPPRIRKNKPKTKIMYSPHKYVSAVGLIEEFNGLSYYKDRFINFPDFSYPILNFIKQV